MSVIRVILSAYLAANLISDDARCEFQKSPIQLNHHQLQLQQNQQHQQQQNLLKAVTQDTQRSLRPTYLDTNITFANRPIERPSLNLVSTADNQQKNVTSEAIKIPNSVPALTEDLMFAEEGKNSLSYAERNSTRKMSRRKNSGSNKSSNKTVFDDEQSVDSSDANEVFDDIDENSGIAGTQKEPDCASHGRYYCTYKEEYPLKLVTEVTKYYKWPLEKLFRDLHAQIMPKLAPDSTGNLVCDSITRVVRPGWARNTNERWLVVINNDNYHQYVTEVVCQYGSNSRCNFIPPCYYSSCQQRYNTQKLLVIDPLNPYRGPFLSEFLFPSCCVCYVPSAADSYQDKYRSSPATIYQRTLQQESASNLYPPQFRPPGLIEEVQSSLVEQSLSSSSPASSSILKQQTSTKPENVAAGVGEVRRQGDQYKGEGSAEGQKRNTGIGDFPRL